MDRATGLPFQIIVKSLGHGPNIRFGYLTSDSYAVFRYTNIEVELDPELDKDVFEVK